jgi:hypothetical protein
MDHEFEWVFRFDASSQIYHFPCPLKANIERTDGNIKAVLRPMCILIKQMMRVF